MKYEILVAYDDKEKNSKINITPTPPNTADSLFHIISALMGGTITIITTCVIDKEARADTMNNAIKAFEKFANLALEEESNDKV